MNFSVDVTCLASGTACYVAWHWHLWATQYFGLLSSAVFTQYSCIYSVLRYLLCIAVFTLWCGINLLCGAVFTLWCGINLICVAVFTLWCGINLLCVAQQGILISFEQSVKVKDNISAQLR